jgi:transposase
MLAKIRRMHLREHRSIREIARRTGLSRNTVRDWLRQPQVVEPRYAKREVTTKLDAYVETLSTWLTSNRHRGKREHRTALSMYQELSAMGYRGGYGRVAAFARRFIAEESMRGSGRAFVPLKFQLGEAFQFDWSTEYAFVGGLRRRLDVAHTKLCASRAFWLTAYPTQSHEMLFDAHARAFAAFGGIPTRGMLDYVAGNIIELMFPPPLCSRRRVMPRVVSGGSRGSGNIMRPPWHGDLPLFIGDCHDRAILRSSRHG